MWAPHPRGRVIRRPQPDFSHRRTRIQRRPAPQELADAEPDPRRNYKYFGIHGSDITDYLKQTIPSHAFHPSLIAAPPPVTSGRRPRNSKEQRRPETAPASTAWFGRTCTDVSDWLRYRPPAHLGLDPDDKPLPYYPTSTSLVTDAKWQTKEFPVLPNILWHWWAERPSSVPLATNPQQVKFDTLVDAVKHRIVRPPGPYTPVSPSTPRSAPRTPRGDNPRSGAETPRPVVAAAGEAGAKLPGEFTPPAGSALSGTSTPRPGSAPGAIGTPRPGGPGEFSPRAAVTPRPGSAAESSRNPPTGLCGRPSDTPRSVNSAGGVAVPGTPLSVGTPRLEPGATIALKCKCSGQSAAVDPSPSGGGANTPTASKPSSPAAGYGRPPPSPRHPNLPHVPKQAVPRKLCSRHPASVPSGLYVQGQGQGSASKGEKPSKPRTGTARDAQAPTMEDLKLMSPDAFATKLVWAEKFKKHGQGSPWPSEEKKTSKAVSAY